MDTNTPTPDPGDCLAWMVDLEGRRVQLGQTALGIQTSGCLNTHGKDCRRLTEQGLQKLGDRLWGFPSPKKGGFSFTRSSLLLDCSVTLETDRGSFRALPEREFLLWSSTGLCQGAPLVVTVDGVRWRVLASVGGATGEDVEYQIPEELPVPMKIYLQAFQDGGELKRQVKEAVVRGNRNLREHREFLYKVFHIMGLPPTRSHDLTKTPLVNFILGRCFHGDGLDLVTGGFTFEEGMTFLKPLHQEVENHHPECRKQQDLSVIDMYVDRVARGVEKSVGWSKEAWHIPDRYTEEEYRAEFARLAKLYRHLELTDPGPIDLSALLSGTQLSLAEPLAN